LEAALIRPLRLDDLEWDSRASLGVSIYPNDARDPERLLIHADLAMYRAKDDPMRSVCYYEPTMDQALRDRRLLAQDLRRSVDRGELDLDYQVQVAVSSSRVCGYEALLRWNHPDRGRIAPSEFIPLSEETGSIVEIGDWVLRTACGEAVRWALPHKVAVNVSSIQMNGVDLCGRVAQILNQTGLPPQRLELEVTETAIIINKERTLHQLHRLRELGVTIAIDDFGTGYSSLDTLRSFPFDKIKLDRSFMREIEHSPQSIAFLRAVMALGRSLNIPILAEGVESVSQFEILKREDCDEAQGFLLGRPTRTIVDIPRHIGLDPSAAA
jgi:predicted signal transduction protein with EAL and GGDEF domain